MRSFQRVSASVGVYRGRHVTLLSRPYSVEPKPSSSGEGGLQKRWDILSTQLQDRIERSATYRDLQELFEAAEKRKRVVLLVLAMVCYILWTQIRKFTANRAAEVTRDFLENPEFKRDAVTFLRSPEIQNAVEGVLKDAAMQLAQDPTVQMELRNLFMRILEDSSFQEVVVTQLKHVLADERVRESAGDAGWAAVKKIVGL